MVTAFCYICVMFCAPCKLLSNVIALYIQYRRLPVQSSFKTERNFKINPFNPVQPIGQWQVQVEHRTFNVHKVVEMVGTQIQLAKRQKYDFSLHPQIQHFFFQRLGRIWTFTWGYLSFVLSKTVLMWQSMVSVTLEELKGSRVECCRN